MKKYLVLVILTLIFVTGCFNQVEYKPKDLSIDHILHYEASSIYSENDTPATNIDLYADKYIVFSYDMYDGFRKVDLTDEQYQEIIDYIQSEEFTSLNKDLSDNNGNSEIISSFTIYYADGTTFEVGGTSVTNETYNGLVNMLRQI